MKKKLNCILLIDDDIPTNFLNSSMIREADCTNHIESCSTGQQGLDFLKANCAGTEKHPAMIFLDINMPGMDGWEFLDLYNKLSPPEKANVIVVMLTTSLNPDDEVKAKQGGAKGFSNKPLNIEKVNDIINQFFSEQK